MFSYRHAFHAGNHGDVLKHLVLLATLRHLVQKDTPLAVFDTHAGAGLYRLDGDFTRTSGEAEQGYLRLEAAGQHDDAAAGSWHPLIQDYLETVRSFNPDGARRIYPGSPFIIHSLLRGSDKLKLFELHPTDARNLSGNIAQLKAGRQITVLREDGFEALGRLLPPPQRRGLILCDPSYEIKTDYARVGAMLEGVLARFPVATCLVWYPIIPRAEAHSLPRRLRGLADKAERPWLHASLTVKGSKITRAPDGREQRPGLPASGVFLVNPPYTLRAQLQAALPQLVKALAQDRHAAFAVEASG